jgi:hypothetical protein
MELGDDVIPMIAIAFAVAVPLCIVVGVNAPSPIDRMARWVVYGSCVLLAVVLVISFIF